MLPAPLTRDCGKPTPRPGGAQTCAVSHAQRGLVFEPRRGIQQARHFLRLSTTGSLLGSWMNVVCSMMSDRLSVTLKKNRKAATA